MLEKSQNLFWFLCPRSQRKTTGIYTSEDKDLKNLRMHKQQEIRGSGTKTIYKQYNRKDVRIVPKSWWSSCELSKSFYIKLWVAVCLKLRFSLIQQCICGIQQVKNYKERRWKREATRIVTSFIKYIYFGVASCSQPLIKIAIRHLLPLEFSTEALPSARIAYAFTEFPYILEDLMCFVE